MRKPLVVSIALLLGSLSSLPAWSAPAATAQAIAPMPLAQALDQFARSSGLQLMYDPALAEGLRSSGAPAGLAPPQQLHALLAGTGLDYRMLTPGSVAIVRSSVAAAP
ncbi:STN domain-containing protein, partial [Xanthomonas sacchari]